MFSIKAFMKLIALAIPLLALLGGCVSNPPTRYVAPKSVVHFPPLGVESEVEIGQTLVSKSNLAIIPAIVLQSDASEQIKQNPLNNRWSGTVFVPAGKLIKVAENEQGSLFKAVGAMFTYFAGTVPCDCGVLVPTDMSKQAVVYINHTIGSTGYEYGEKPVTYAKSTEESWSQGSFKNELVYGGLSQKTISISYREFVNDVARPAFTQEIKYDLNESDIIGFRGARFQVLKATNTTIRYKTLKALD